MSNQEGTIVCAELGIPGPITVTDTPGRSHDGQTLIAIIQEPTRDKVRDEWVPDSSGVNRHVVEYADVVKTKYVFRMDKDSALAQAVHKRKLAESAKYTAEDNERNANIEREKADKEAVSAKERADRLYAQLKNVEDALRSARSRNQVMEKDLAKLRQSLGEIRIKEILASQE